MDLDLIDKKVDVTETVKKTQNFLEVTFQTLMNYAGTDTAVLSSPLLDPSGVAGGNGLNRTHEKFMKDAEKIDVIQWCRRAVKAVNDCINSCSKSPRRPYSQILHRRYVDWEFDTTIYTDLDYSKSQYYRLRNKAFVEFAQKLGRYAEQYHVDLPTLVVFY